MSDARCAGCGQTATCYGAYEGAPSSYACDDCCGHGCEDGRCEPVTATTLALAAARDDVLRAARDAAPILRWAIGPEMVDADDLATVRAFGAAVDRLAKLEGE